jgi:hypothetical protein
MRKDPAALGNPNCRRWGNGPASVGNLNCRWWGKLIVADQLVRKIGELLEWKASSAWLWKGCSVYMVDGSTASMPETPANQQVYPQPVSQKLHVGFPLARFVALISLATGAVLDVALGPCLGKRTGETSLLRNLVQRMKAGSIVLGDRSFASYFGIAALLQRKIDGVFRMH